MKTKKNSVSTVDELNFIKDWLKKRPTINELKFNQHIDVTNYPFGYCFSDEVKAFRFYFPERTTGFLGSSYKYGGISVIGFSFKRLNEKKDVVVSELKQHFYDDLRLIKARYKGYNKDVCDILHFISKDEKDESFLQEYSCMYKLFCFDGRLHVRTFKDKVISIEWSFLGKGYGSAWCRIELTGDKFVGKSVDSVLKRELKNHKDLEKFCAHVINTERAYNEVKHAVSFCKKYLDSKKKGGEKRD